MWNFFIMFFYEASLEISISLVIGFKYIWARDSVTQPEETSDSNAFTRKVHTISIYSFSVLLVLSLLAIIVIMTRKAPTLERLKPRFGSLYESLSYEGNFFARFYPVWFMIKRIGFVFLVFYFKSTQGMVLALMHVYLFELCAVLS